MLSRHGYHAAAGYFPVTAVTCPLGLLTPILRLGIFVLYVRRMPIVMWSASIDIPNGNIIYTYRIVLPYKKRFL